MGKQINYWMGYEDFLQIGQAALDCRCVIIKAVSGKLSDKTKELVRSRLFAIAGYYDSEGEYIPRPECITKTFNRLARIVKKVAPYTESTDTYISIREEDDLQEKEWKHKEYISPYFLHLKLFQNYKLWI